MYIWESYTYIISGAHERFTGSWWYQEYIIKKGREYWMLRTRKSRGQEFKHWPMRVCDSIVNCGCDLNCMQREHDSDWKRQQITIQNKCSSRIYHKTHEKCLYSPQSGEKSIVELLGLVTCARREVMLLSEDILYRVYSAFDTLLPSHIMNSW